jgi:hypothetical protein
LKLEIGLRLIMKFILFFYVLSLLVITGFLLADDQITGSDFFQQYLSGDDTTVEQRPIPPTALPSEVMQSFSEGAFGNKVISQAYVIPATTDSIPMNQWVSGYDFSGETYVLLLAADSNHTSTTLKYSNAGKLINVEN